MSRSFKKEPYFKSIRYHAKHWSNKRVRQFRGDTADGYAYRKVYNSFSIYKQYSRLTLTEFINSYCNIHRLSTLVESSEKYQYIVDLWYKCHRRK